MPKKWTVKELTRLAFIYAEGDRRSLAQAQGKADKDFARECIDLADAMRDYRVKRWGRTTLEAELDNCTLVDIRDLAKAAKTSEDA